MDLKITSLGFPSMFNGFGSTTSRVVVDGEATMQNLLLLLGSEKGEFLGDPYFGIRLKRYLFEQNNYVLRDILIDEIFTQITLFMPQLRVERGDISITQNVEGSRAYLNASIRAMNKKDFTVDTYNLVLYESEGTQ
jgi:phage baseplate assembly protein W